jgi:hypothetical protein
VQSVTFITSREQIYEHKVKRLQTFTNYKLDELKQQSWQQYFKYRYISIDDNALSQMHQAYGGNAEAMFILSTDIAREAQENLKVYWQDNCEDILRHSNLKQLVQYQLDKLKNNNLQAYKLLCRLCIYPNQDITVPKVGLFCLLWDVPENRKQRVIDSLVERSLVKVNNYGYYLHTVIRIATIENLSFMNEFNEKNLLFIKYTIDDSISYSCKLQEILKLINKKFVRLSKHYIKASFRAFYLGFFIFNTLEEHSQIVKYHGNDRYYCELACILEQAFATYCQNLFKNVEELSKQLAKVILEKYINFIIDYFNKNKEELQKSIIREYKKLDQQVIYLKIMEIIIEHFGIELSNFCEININKIIDDDITIDLLSEIVFNLEIIKIDKNLLNKNNKVKTFRVISSGISKAFSQNKVYTDAYELKDIFKKTAKQLISRSKENKDGIPQCDPYDKIPQCNPYGCIIEIDSNILKLQLTEEDKIFLKNYYDTNKLLIYSLKQNIDVSPEVRSHIQDTLLLPIAEIEKRPFQN